MNDSVVVGTSKNSKGLVSVIIPTYNRALLCKRAVESVLNQTYRDIEVIVVDDGSNDGTEHIIRGINSNVKYLMQNNAGVSTARNTGLDIARGEYIALLDSDDTWLPWKIEGQLKVLDNFPEAGMVWTDMIAVDESGIELSKAYNREMFSAYDYFDIDRNFKEKRIISELWDNCPIEWMNMFCYSGNIFPWMFMGNLVPTPTVLIRRERQKIVGGFNTKLVNSGEDYDFHFRTCAAGDVAFMDFPSIIYRVGAADQLTAPQLYKWVARNNLMTVNNVFNEMHGNIGLPKPLIKKRMAESYSWVGYYELFDNKRIARTKFAESLCWDILQPMVILYYLASFLPTSVIIGIRKFKRLLSKFF